MSKTLYVSDLDGTLLGSNQQISERTCRIINQLTENGLTFACATARSRFSSAKALSGLHLSSPMVVYNGAFIQDMATGEVLSGHFIPHKQAEHIINQYISYGIIPIVYAFIDGIERFSYVPDKSCQGLLNFVATRRGDPRIRVTDITGLTDGDIFYITAMGDEALLAQFNDSFSSVDVLGRIYSRDIYSGDYWLELMSSQATKAGAVLELKSLMKCDRMVCFGDAINDIPMFLIADECYATSNADPELKNIATGVIGSNNDDAVAQWLEQYSEK